MRQPRTQCAECDLVWAQYLVKHNFSTANLARLSIHIRYGVTVRIKDRWDGAGKIGKAIGRAYLNPRGQYWVPVEWQDVDDPDWFKLQGLEIIKT
jgi:hypothetical protein